MSTLRERIARLLAQHENASANAIRDLWAEAPALLRLLDALLESNPYHCWCGGGRDVQDFGHEPKCERIRAALREAEAALEGDRR